MFADGRCPEAVRRVADMSRREREAVFHTHEDLSGVPWLVNADGGVEPASACDYAYLESAFSNDQAFFLKTIGSVNVPESIKEVGFIVRTDCSDPCQNYWGNSCSFKKAV